AMDFIIVIPLAILISTLAACLPAWSASRLKPAQALRYE
ncbi:MAG TPA: hypothetical protein PLV25_01335, partial [Opitutales bacterium]|nr:hypothetical protein [Opitutales bacterium]